VVIIIDTREQRPWSFPLEMAATKRGTLSAGDYALEGDPLFAIERKSLDDFVGTISTGWDRFCRELDRMEDQGFCPKTVIIEGTWMQILNRDHSHPDVNTPFIRSRIAKLAFRDVHILFADNPFAAAMMAWGLFNHRLKELQGVLFDE